MTSLHWSTHRTEHHRLVATLEDATLAASLHNSQPWRFVVSPREVEVWLALGDRPSIVDGDGRWALQSVGAALGNLELGVRCRLERSAMVTLSPSSSSSSSSLRELAASPVALLAIGESNDAPDPGQRWLHGAVVRRRTSRWPSIAPVGQETVRAVLTAAQGSSLTDGVDVVVAGEGEIRGLLALTSEVDLSWNDDVAYLAEVERWAHRGDSRGISASSLGPSDSEGHYAGRDFSLGVSARGVAPAAERFEDLPELVVVRTGADTPQDWLRAGVAVQRLMLAATAAGVDVGVLGQLVERDSSRSAAAELLEGRGGGTVQQILRLGRSDPAHRDLPRTSRRPIASVVSWRR